jgi:phospholipid-translocating ATPase
MSQSHHYHQPNAPNTTDEDTDSDLDIELGELDPVRSPEVPRQNSATYDFARRIPLRTLRAGRTRHRLSYEEGDGEDTRSLLGNTDNGKHDYDGRRQSNDHDAALSSSQAGRRRQSRKPSAVEQFASYVGLGSSAREARSSGSPGDDEEPEDEHDPSSNRTVQVGLRQPTRFPINAVSNSRYTPWNFLPRTLYNEFKFFINMYFLLVALSQIIPALRIGYLFTYVLPLSMVMTITLGKEAWDDLVRRRRDAEANSEPFTVLRFDSSELNGRRTKKSKSQTNGSANGSTIHSDESGAFEITKSSRDIKVGDVVKLNKNQRVPADMIILSSRPLELHTAKAAIDSQLSSGPLLTGEGNENINTNEDSGGSGGSGEAFIRTDQLDGETDWKLRIASPLSQSLRLTEYTKLHVVAGKPDRKVNEFVGTLTYAEDGQPSDENKSSPLTVENTAWANTVIASSSAVYGVVIYTGSQTRQAMSTTASRPKVGLLELEINNLTKILCILTLSISVLLVVLGRIDHQAERPWYIAALRFLILFSTVIPISLRVNLDMGKVVYAWYIEHDKSIPDTVVRTSNIPEDLGRIEYLLSDKTGTLTQNEMDLKKIHVGTVSYANEAMEEVCTFVNQAFVQPQTGEESSATLVTPSSTIHMPIASATRTRREIGTRVRDLILALALCHNVTPTMDETADGQLVTSYQASSPDEIAIVQWTEAVGLKLMHRDRTSMILQSTKTDDVVVRVHILNIFPFTSEGKRMGILVKFATSKDDTSNEINEDSEIWFYQKGADTVMSSIVLPSDWLEEETANMAREGLRTLVIGRKKLSPSQYQEFSQQYAQASLVLHAREATTGEVVKTYLEKDLELLGVTGVEDKLQKDVKGSLELLRNAGIKIWMLTGDKVETARCVAVNSKLVARGQFVHTMSKLQRKDAALDSLQTLSSNPSSALLIDGESLSVMLTHHSQQFIAIAARLPAVIACRVSPIQKAELANLIKSYSGKRVCCIGDGGNDVSMIQAADVGVGIVGKEGKQASLAADYSIMQFHYLTKLLVWHGRNSYKRSAKLAQFVIHRGVIMSVCQVMFSIASKFGPNALYRVSLLSTMIKLNLTLFDRIGLWSAMQLSIPLLLSSLLCLIAMLTSH